MSTSTAPSRPRFVCPACRDRLEHRLITLHAGEDTIVVCKGAWDGLPKWMQDGIALLDKKGKSLSKRREVAREIMEELRS